jgi:zinc protease
MKKIVLVIAGAFGMLYAGAHRNTGSMNGRPVPAGDPPAKSVIADYIQAIGGAEEVKKIKTTRIVIEKDMSGPMRGKFHREGKPDTLFTINVNLKVVIEQQQMAPNKFFATYDTDSSSRIKLHSKTVFDGKDGFVMQQGTRSPLSGVLLARLKREEHPIMQLQYLSDPAIKLENRGIGKIDGEDCYEIQVDFPDGGGSRTEYYAVKSKLLMRSVDASIKPATVIDYDDYKMAGHVLFSYRRMESSSGEHPREEKVINIQVNTGVSEDNFKL